MRKGIALAALGLLLGAAAVTAAITLGPGDGTASSHREAPLIADDPSADLTDLYAFRSPDRPNTVTIIANVIPGEDPAAGPNWYTFSPNARYNLKIDTTGDGNGDVTYRFEFKRKTGPYFLGDTAQPFTVTRVRGGKATVVARGTTPPNNIGPRSTPNYRQLTTKSIVSFDGGASKAFAGQRDDPFYGDIGAIFDLVAIRKGTGNQGGGKDFFAGYGVHTFAVQVPVAGLEGQRRRDRRLRDGRPPQGHHPRQPDPQQRRVGAGQPPRQPARQRGDHPHRSQGPVERGEPVARREVPQVLRDADPGCGDQPAVQARRTRDGRDDLVAVLLTGVPKLNYTGPKIADLLRLNLDIPVTASPKRLGVLAGDNQGWPNGRRLGDDVIDIAEQAVGGFLKGTKLPLGDGVDADDQKLLGAFPYVADPQNGFANTKGK